MATVTATAARRTDRRSARGASRSATRARLAIAAGTLAAAALVLQSGLAQMLVRRDPQRAARLAPDNAEIAVAAARAAMAEGEGPDASQVRGLVSAALRRDATMTAAIEFRAIDLSTTGDKRGAQQLFVLSGAVSRRSLSTRVWLIQQAVERGDVGAALKHMDIALRTSSAAPPIVFPALARALTEPALVVPIARLVDRPSEWRVMFLDFAAKRADPPAAAALLMAMRDRGAIAAGETDRKLIGRLTTGYQFALARRLEDHFRPVSGPRPLLADGNFTDPSARYPFGWGLGDGSVMGATMGRVGDKPALAYQAMPARNGQVAAQLLTLSAGRYRLATATAQAGDPAASPQWALDCARRDGGRIVVLDQPVRPGAAAKVEFALPADCQAQWLTLRLRPSLGAAGQEGAIAWVSLAAL